MKGCKLKVDVETHELVAKVRVTERDAAEPSEGEAKLTALEAGGSWYLITAPRLGAGGAFAAGLRGLRDQMCACKDVRCAEDAGRRLEEWKLTVRREADLPRDTKKDIDELHDELSACRRKLHEASEAAEMKAVIAKYDQLKDRMCACADRSCYEQVQQEMRDLGQAAASRTQGLKPRDEDQRKLAEVMRAYVGCAGKAMALEATPRPPDDPSPDDMTSSGSAGLTSLPACAEHRKRLDRLDACARYPKSAADALRRVFSELEKSWAAGPRDPAQMTRTCEAQAEVVKKILDTYCP
jgi:hypothetical protein